LFLICVFCQTQKQQGIVSEMTFLSEIKLQKNCQMKAQKALYHLAENYAKFS
jgi:hypothetical protein